MAEHRARPVPIEPEARPGAPGLRTLLATSIVVAPGVADALTARLVERAGFGAAYMSGFAVAASAGKPDVGLLSFKEVLDRAAQIVEVVGIPLIVDADTGYGGPLNVVRTVREFERIGVSCIQIEDQEFPKKCGVLDGKRLVAAQDMVGRVKAAVDARRSREFVVIARTDAIDVEGIEAAIDRGCAYGEAGADLLMFSGPRGEGEVRRIVGVSPAPIVYINAEGIASRPLFSVPELQDMGIKVAVFPLTLVLSAARAGIEALATLRRTGSTSSLTDTLLSWDDFNGLVGLPAAHAGEQRYASGL